MNILDLLEDKEKEYIRYNIYNKNTIIENEGNECKSLSIIIYGEVKLSSYSFNGQEINYFIMGKNELYGNNLLFSSYPFYKGTITALNETKIAYLDKDSLLMILSENKAFLECYLKILSDKAKALNDRIKLISFNSIQERFDYFMYLNSNSVKIKSITSLSLILNVSRESLSRYLNSLIKQKKISYINKIISKNN